MTSTDIFTLFQSNVRTFVRAMGQVEGAYPSRDLLEFRWKLIDEEMAELQDEYEAYCDETKNGGLIYPTTAMQIMKELTDLEYVVAGYGVALGFPILPVRERHVSFPENHYGFRGTMAVGLAWRELGEALEQARGAHNLALRLCGVSLRPADPCDVYRQLMFTFGVLTDAIIGFAEECGFNLVNTFLAVQKSNMSKLGPDGKPIYREDGKVLKGPNYHKPDMSVFIAGRKDVAEA